MCVVVVVCVYLCMSISRFFDVCVSLLLFLKGGCVSTLLGSTTSFCCSERRHAAMTTAGASSIWSGYSPPRPRTYGGSSSKVDNRLLDLTGRETRKKDLNFQTRLFFFFFSPPHVNGCLLKNSAACVCVCVCVGSIGQETEFDC